MKIYYRYTIIALILFCATQKTFCQQPDSVKKLIDSALYFIQAKSLFSNNINWQKVKDSAYIKSADAKTFYDAFPALVYAYKQLKDYHGMFAVDDSLYRYPPPVNFDTVLSAGIKKEFLKGPKIVTHYFDNNIAYLRVPSINVFTQEDINKRGNMLRDSLCKLLSKNPTRFIIDLRMNSGGNSAPMISGISPLLTNIILGYGVDRNNNFLPPTKLKDGVVPDGSGHAMVNIINNCTLRKPVSIALLIGFSTVSSGEILAAFLEQQPNVKTFGERTGGFCNATEGFVFMHEHAYLLLAVNKIADAKKHVYDDMFIEPDVFIKSDDNYDDLSKDPTVIKAIKWLNTNE